MSTPATPNPPTGGTVPINPTTGGSAPAGGSGTPATTGSTGKAKATVSSGNTTFVERLIADPTWPSTLILDLNEGN